LRYRSLEADVSNESKEVVKDLIGDPTDTTIVAFTDGSCQGNFGPCGSGAVEYPSDNEGIGLKRPVAPKIGLFAFRISSMSLYFP
jgi:hypothetical protein